jgi:hypothetical protein
LSNELDKITDAEISDDEEGREHTILRILQDVVVAKRTVVPPRDPEPPRRDGIGDIPPPPEPAAVAVEDAEDPPAPAAADEGHGAHVIDDADPDFGGADDDV